MDEKVLNLVVRGVPHQNRYYVHTCDGVKDISLICSEIFHDSPWFHNFLVPNDSNDKGRLKDISMYNIYRVSCVQRIGYRICAIL